MITIYEDEKQRGPGGGTADVFYSSNTTCYILCGSLLVSTTPLCCGTRPNYRHQSDPFIMVLSQVKYIMQSMSHATQHADGST